jgi:methylated-DNA-protein-cysteine methyltransferase-like protein
MKQSEFFNSVYEIVAKIPKGRVMTYGQIAALLGVPTCSRRVGQAMYNTPSHLNIPAHRVVNSRGGLAPAFVMQRILLEEEGVPFRENGCVDIKKAVYRTFAG